MPTFGEINGEEPSTVTFKLATVSQDWNSTVRHQEIVTIGGTESTLAQAAVLAATPQSTAWALAVREVAPTTIVSVSTGSVRVHQSTAADLNVTVAGYVAPSTTVSVSTGSVRVHQSTAADLNVTVAGYVAPSTIVTVSTGSVRVHQSTATDLNVAVTGNQSSNSSVYLPVRLTNGTAFLNATEDYAVGDTISTVSLAVLGPTLLMRTGAPAPASTDTWKQVFGSTYGVLYTAMATDSGVSAMDSTNTALRVNVVAGSAAGDTTVTASFAAGYVSSAAPAGNSSGLIVRVVDYSTTVNVSSLGGAVIVRSSAADMLVTASTGSVRVHQSTAADLNVTVAGYSTTVNVSSVAGAVVTRVNTSSGGAVEGSTTVPAADALGLHVRHVLPTMSNAVSTVTSSNSTAFYSVLSSAAGLTQKVYAYSITSTAASPLAVEFLQSTVTVVWALDIGSGSSGVTGANLAVPPPGVLFASSVAGNINVRLGSSGVQIRVSLAYFST